MSCLNCMRYRPESSIVGFDDISEFTCLECGEVYALAGVGPGNYWEKKEEQEAEKDRLLRARQGKA